MVGLLNCIHKFSKTNSRVGEGEKSRSTPFYVYYIIVKAFHKTIIFTYKKNRTNEYGNGTYKQY